MKMKKVVLMFLVICLVFVSLYAQGTTETSSDKETQKELVFLSWRYKPDDAFWQSMVEAYKVVEPNTKLTLINVSDNNSMEQKAAAMIAGNLPLDMVWTDSSVTQTMGKADLLEPLEGYIKRDGFDTSRLFMASKYDHMWDGKLVGLPAIPMGYLIFYNKDLFDAAGVPYPTNDWTMDDFLKTAQALTKPEIKQFGYGTRPWIGTHDLSYIYAFGGNWFDKNGKPVMDQENAIKAYQFIQDLIFKYKVAPAPSGVAGSGAQAVSFDSGKLAMNWTGTWDIKGTEGPNSKWSFRWGIVLPPKGAYGQYPIIISNGWSILKNSKNKDVAWNFLKWWSSGEIQQLLAQYGEIPTNIEEARKYAITFLDETDRNTVFKALQEGVSRPTNWPYYARSERESNAYRDRIYIGEDVGKVLAEMKKNVDSIIVDEQGK
ncbi:sugar ABC transporter substrate-binding protein [uncultured Sphaerochaeta sp.]|uniref:ABC transporter substrate-binding protein n=1 Tax=uncultured Sphaerochaeta sp. TaxID=886478 RepID=UPI002A0A2696|nr:sugar ABC transporter substrate-binding protein [uncultured Sphaerochaeta sp.]